MKTLSTDIVLACFALSLWTGCQSNPVPKEGTHSKNQNDASTQSLSPRPPEETPWEIHYVANCPSPSSSQFRGQFRGPCRGAYGFSVKSDGTYRVGPGPEGQEFTGTLASEDFERIVRAIRPDGAASTNHEEYHLDCEDAPNGPNDKNSCDPKLLADFRDLVSRYYPEPFPSRCLHASMDLKNSYEQAETCETDADCAYLDDDYFPMDPTSRSNPSLPLDDCAYVPSLIAANSFKAVVLQRDLILKREIARRICGRDVMKPSCSNTRSFDPWFHPPICSKGRCRSRTA